MKFIKVSNVFCFFYFIATEVGAKDIINTYVDAQFIFPPAYYNPAQGTNTWTSVKTSGSFTGEYQISLRDHYWFWLMLPNSPFSHHDASLFDENNFKRTFSIELVSFPFSRSCAFELGGCADGTTDRNLFMPDMSTYNGSNRWEYPVTGNPIYTNKLYRDRGVGFFNHFGYSTGEDVDASGNTYQTSES